MSMKLIKNGNHIGARMVYRFDGPDPIELVPENNIVII